MSLESSIQALADAIAGFTEVYKNKEVFAALAQTETPKPGKKTKSGKKAKESSTPVDTDKNPYQAHPSDDDNRTELIKIVRQEFARVVKYRGESNAKKLLEKYQIEELDQIRDVDIQSFLTEASALSEDGKNGVVVTEVTFDRVKHILKKVYMEKGETVTLGLLKNVGVDDIKKLKEDQYGKVYALAEKILA